MSIKRGRSFSFRGERTVETRRRKRDREGAVRERARLRETELRERERTSECEDVGRALREPECRPEQCENVREKERERGDGQRTRGRLRGGCQERERRRKRDVSSVRRRKQRPGGEFLLQEKVGGEEEEERTTRRRNELLLLIQLGNASFKLDQSKLRELDLSKLRENRASRGERAGELRESWN